MLRHDTCQPFPVLILISQVRHKTKQCRQAANEAGRHQMFSTFTALKSFFAVTLQILISTVQAFLLRLTQPSAIEQKSFTWTILINWRLFARTGRRHTRARVRYCSSSLSQNRRKSFCNLANQTTKRVPEWLLPSEEVCFCCSETAKNNCIYGHAETFHIKPAFCTFLQACGVTDYAVSESKCNSYKTEKVLGSSGLWMCFRCFSSWKEIASACSGALCGTTATISPRSVLKMTR